MDVAAMSQMAGGVVPTPPVAEVLPQGADDLVVEDFQRSLEGGQVAAPPPGTQAPQTNGGKQGTLGDAILSGLENASGELRTAWNHIRVADQKPGQLMTISELMKLQTQIVQFSFLSELVSKGVTKTLQDLDSMVKMQ